MEDWPYRELEQETISAEGTVSTKAVRQSISLYIQGVAKKPMTSEWNRVSRR